MKNIVSSLYFGKIVKSNLRYRPLQFDINFCIYLQYYIPILLKGFFGEVKLPFLIWSNSDPFILEKYHHPIVLGFRRENLYLFLG